MARFVEAHYQADASVAAAAVQALVTALAAEDLVQPTGEAAAQPAYSNGQRAPFVAPVLQKHTDMQDLLLLDPIHEVDETGWPSLKA